MIDIIMNHYFPNFTYLLSAIIFNPCAGRRVIDGSGSTMASGASRSRYFRAMVASTSAASIRAKLLPMQILGPPPKGK